jgi:hypothetical protein
VVSVRVEHPERRAVLLIIAGRGFEPHPYHCPLSAEKFVFTRLVGRTPPPEETKRGKPVPLMTVRGLAGERRDLLGGSEVRLFEDVRVPVVTELSEWRTSRI